MPLDYSIILKVILETTLLVAEDGLEWDQNKKDSDEDRNNTVGDNRLFEETVGGFEAE